MKKSIVTSVLFIVIAFAATAQQAAKKELTAADYDRATKFLSFNTSKLVNSGNQRRMGRVGRFGIK